MFSVLLFTKKCDSILRTITNNSERCRRTAPTAHTKFYRMEETRWKENIVFKAIRA